jgi:hypothetical protein
MVLSALMRASEEANDTAEEEELVVDKGARKAGSGRGVVAALSFCTHSLTK